MDFAFGRGNYQPSRDRQGAICGTGQPSRDRSGAICKTAS